MVPFFRYFVEPLLYFQCDGGMSARGTLIDGLATDFSPLSYRV